MKYIYHYHATKPNYYGDLKHMGGIVCLAYQVTTDNAYDDLKKIIAVRASLPNIDGLVICSLSLISEEE